VRVIPPFKAAVRAAPPDENRSPYDRSNVRAGTRRSSISSRLSYRSQRDNNRDGRLVSPQRSDKESRARDGECCLPGDIDEGVR
jgi:hypothetical protein